MLIHLASCSQDERNIFYSLSLYVITNFIGCGNYITYVCYPSCPDQQRHLFEQLISSVKGPFTDNVIGQGDGRQILTFADKDGRGGVTNDDSNEQNYINNFF